MKKKIEAKQIIDKDVIIAIDISRKQSNLDNIKSMLKIFSTIVQDYNYKGHVLLCDDEIKFEFNIDDIDKLDNYVLPKTSDNADYRPVFDYVEEKVNNENWDLFKIYFVTDGLGVFPRESQYDTIWITGKDFGLFPFGEVFELNI